MCIIVTNLRTVKLVCTKLLFLLLINLIKQDIVAYGTHDIERQWPQTPTQCTILLASLNTP